MCTFRLDSSTRNIYLFCAINSEIALSGLFEPRDYTRCFVIWLAKLIADRCRALKQRLVVESLSLCFAGDISESLTRSRECRVVAVIFLCKPTFFICSFLIYSWSFSAKRVKKTSSVLTGLKKRALAALAPIFLRLFRFRRLSLDSIAGIAKFYWVTFMAGAYLFMIIV